MKYKYHKGSEEDFDGHPDAILVVKSASTGRVYHLGLDYAGRDKDIEKVGDIVIAHREPITECTRQDGVMFDAPIGMPLNEFECRQQSLCAGDSDVNVNGILLNKITAADIEVVKYDLTKVDDFASDATINKYTRDCKGVQVDVYDVLQAFDVTNPALQHLIKKALCVGIRGHKTKQQDLQDIIDSAIRAKELESNK